MSKKFSVFTFIIAVTACCLAGLNYYELTRQDVQFVMYLGTNDKDSNIPVFNHDDAKIKLDEILSKHFSGFTVAEALGGWTDDNGKISHEYTLVIYLSDTTIKKVHSAADDLLREFNQSSVLIQTNKTITEFYAGQNL